MFTFIFPEIVCVCTCVCMCAWTHVYVWWMNKHYLFSRGHYLYIFILFFKGFLSSPHLHKSKQLLLFIFRCIYSFLLCMREKGTPGGPYAMICPQPQFAWTMDMSILGVLTKAPGCEPRNFPMWVYLHYHHAPTISSSSSFFNRFLL